MRRFRKMGVLALSLMMVFELASCVKKEKKSTRETTAALHNDFPTTVNSSDDYTTTETEPSETEAVTYEGILVQSLHIGERYNWKSTGTYMCDTITVNLDFIDSETGEITHFKTFSSEQTHSCSSYLSVNDNVNQARTRFNADYSAMVALLTRDDGAEHVGWIDEAGEFFDVSEKITHKSDFGSITKHSQPCFWGDYMYFYDQTEGVECIKRVPLNNLQENTVELMWSKNKSNGHVYPKPDGSIPDEPYFYEYSTADSEYGAYPIQFGGWINTNECVGSDNGMIYRYNLEGFSGKQSTGHWYSSKTELIPNVSGRVNLVPVLSPDGKKVAFISSVNGKNELFVVDASGGEPKKIDTDYNFSEVSFIGSRVGLIGWTNNSND